MVIEVRFHGELSRHATEGASGIMMIHISDEVSIEELLIGLDINLEEVAVTTVNGGEQDFDFVLDDGDNLEIFPKE